MHLKRSNNTIFHQNKLFNQLFSLWPKRSNIRAFLTENRLPINQNNPILRLFQPRPSLQKKGFTRSSPKTRSTPPLHPAQTAHLPTTLQKHRSRTPAHRQDQSQPCFPTVRRTSRTRTQYSVQQTQASLASHHPPEKYSPANDQIIHRKRGPGDHFTISTGHGAR